MMKDARNKSDCNDHDECQDGPVMDLMIVQVHMVFGSRVDYCNQLTCWISCGENGGDCDSNSECLSHHFCGSNDCLNSTLI